MNLLFSFALYFILFFLDEGEECSTGDVSDPVPKEICGPGLFCKTKSQDEFDGVCSRSNYIINEHFFKYKFFIDNI